MHRIIYTQLAAVFAYLLVGVMGDSMMAVAARITQGAEVAPYQYRILLPLLLHELDPVVDTRVLNWSIWFLILAVFSLTLHEFSRSYFRPATITLWTVLGMTTVTMLLYSHSGIFPYWAALELLLFTLALLLLRNQRFNSLLAVVVIATLNRETAVFIVMMVAAVTRSARLTFTLGFGWATAYGAVRLFFGPRESLFTLQETVTANLQPVSVLVIVLLAWFCGALLYAAWKGRHDAPELVVRASRFIPIYLLAVAVFGIWTEIRLMLPMFSVLIPMAMAGYERDIIENLGPGR